MNKRLLYVVLAFAVIGVGLLAFSFAAEAPAAVVIASEDVEATNICTEEAYIEFGLCTPDPDPDPDPAPNPEPGRAIHSSENTPRLDTDISLG